MQMGDVAKRALLSGYLKEDEAAEEFERSVQTLRRWRRQRIGPPWADTPAGPPLYPIEGGREWLRNRTVFPRRSGT